MADTTEFDVASREQVSSIEDDRCNPELEARLYAQIYHSNETHSDINDTAVTTQQTPPPPLMSLNNPLLNGPSKHYRDFVSSIHQYNNSTSKRRPRDRSRELSNRYRHQRRENRVFDAVNRKNKKRKTPKSPRRHQNKYTSPEKTPPVIQNPIQEALEPTIPVPISTTISEVCSTVVESSETCHTAEEVDDSSSKYNVTAKRVEPEPVMPEIHNSNCSDSDDSVLEVPVPPKPAPLLIDLNDSDQCLSSDEEENPAVVMATKSPEKTKSPSVIDQDSNSSHPIVITDETSNSNLPQVDDLIINCTQVEKGVSNVEEIRQIREVSSVHDDDSMTESEAMNWGRIEGQINADKNCQRATETMETVGELWNPLNEETSTQRGVEQQSSKETGSSSAVSCLNEIAREAVVAVGEGSSESRKRPREPEDDVENDRNTEADQKRQRQILAKNIEAYYNNPRSGDSLMDLQQLQSRMPNDPRRWSILNVDCLSRKPKDKRKTCANCHRDGHTRDKCLERQKPPSCHMCGEVGHLEPRCPQSMCLTCGTKYSSYRKTCEVCRILQCSTCKGYGHTHDNCPDLWRRYHQTTSGTSVTIPANPNKILKPPNQLSCCNCTKRGHDSTTCTKYRWSQHFVTPRFVTSYTKAPFYSTDEVEETQEITEIPNLMDVQIDNPPIPVELRKSRNKESRIIFQYQNYVDKPLKSQWKTKRIFPNKKGNDYNYFKENSQNGPDFLEKHFPENSPYKIHVSVYLISKKSQDTVEISVQSFPKCDELLEKLIRQWLLRSSQDRQLMKTIGPLPWDTKGFFTTLKTKLSLFAEQTNARAWKHLKTLRVLNQFLENIGVSAEDRALSDVPEVQSEFSKKTRTIEKLKLRLLSSLYNYNFIPTAKNIIGELKNLLNKSETIDLNGNVIPKFYFAGLWFYFELFTPHMSNYVYDAAKAWEKQMMKFKKTSSNEKDSNRLNLHPLIPKNNPDIINSETPYEKDVQSDEHNMEVSFNDQSRSENFHENQRPQIMENRQIDYVSVHELFQAARSNMNKKMEMMAKKKKQPAPPKHRMRGNRNGTAFASKNRRGRKEK